MKRYNYQRGGDEDNEDGYNNSYYNYRREGPGNNNVDRGGNLNHYYKPANEGSGYRRNLKFKQDDEDD
jgi:hypothetical protein